MYLALFDLDHTLLAADSDYLWGRFLVDEGVVDAEYYAAENERFNALYQAGTLDIHAYQRFALAPLIAHPIARMQALRERFVAEVVTPAIAAQAPRLLAAHRERGDRVVIITATNRFITEPIAEHFGVDDLIATEPETVDGVYTGKIAGTPSFQHGKIERAEAWVAGRDEGFDRVIFYSDSRNDIPLLEWADVAVAVDPDTALAETAHRAGWPIVSLRGDAWPFEALPG